MHTTAILALLLTGVLVVIAHGGEKKEKFSATITKEVGAQYLVVTPEDYDSDEKHPLLIFLHGRGEQGDDINRVKIHGPFRTVKELGLPFIVVAPQSPLDEWWNIDTLSALVDHLLETLPVDENRVYLTGLSMGGFGTWELAIRRPEVFAAIAPICGRGQPSKAERIRDVPVWAFHGAKDDVILLRDSAAMVNALYKVGNNARLTVYPEVGHDSWTETYKNPDFYAWLLSYSRQSAGGGGQSR